MESTFRSKILAHGQEQETRIALLGLPFEGGGAVRGAVMAPQALRIAGIASALQSLGHKVRDFGDLRLEKEDTLYIGSVPTGVRNWYEVMSFLRHTEERAYEIFELGGVPVFCGGDHSLSMAIVNAAARFAREVSRPLFVLWLDAHADFNTPRTSPSGNLHGMTIAFLTGDKELSPLLSDDVRVPMNPEHFCLFGLRSVDSEERKALSHKGFLLNDMRKIDEFGVSLLLEQFLEKVQLAGGMLHVSLDIDFLDSDIAPATGTAVQGGATFREAHLVMEMLCDSKLVTSFDIMELNPYLDDRGKSARLLVSMAESLFGKRIVG